MDGLTGVKGKRCEMAGKAAGYQCSIGFGDFAREFLNDGHRDPAKTGLFGNRHESSNRAVVFFEKETANGFEIIVKRVIFNLGQVLPTEFLRIQRRSTFLFAIDLPESGGRSLPDTYFRSVGSFPVRGTLLATKIE
ncbi:hypothetical protein OAG56_02165 [Mariniblastus sp.]|nr:hypothetical protein [Mariniblastus sp.]MDB4756150.1 hypothetical protein [Mariniblastus sp.]